MLLYQSSREYGSQNFCPLIAINYHVIHPGLTLFWQLSMDLHKSWSPGRIEFCWNGTPPCNFFQETDLKHGISFSSAYNWTSKESEGSILKSFPVTKSLSQSFDYYVPKSILSIISCDTFSKLSIIYLVMGRIDISCDMSITSKILITKLYDRLFRIKVRPVQTSSRQRPGNVTATS